MMRESVMFRGWRSMIPQIILGGFLGLNDTKALSNQQTSSLTSNGWQVQSRENVNNDPSAPFESAHSFNKSGTYEKSLSGDRNSWNSALFDFGTARNGREHVGFKVTNSTLNTNDQLSMIPQAPQAHSSATLGNIFNSHGIHKQH